MDINVADLFQKQKILDDYINKNHPPMEGENRLKKKIMALLTEVGELTNTLPEVFKFWSNKKNDRKNALKEYVDCIHFALSIGLELDHNKWPIGNAEKEKTVIDQIASLYRISQVLYYSVKIGAPRDISVSYYELVVEYLLDLGSMLEFSWDEIVQAYTLKYEENISRQDNGY